MGEYSSVIRDDRFFEICGEWYFNTREGIEGPFQNQLEAKKKLSVYLAVFGNLDLADRCTPLRSAISVPNHGLLPTHLQWR